MTRPTEEMLEEHYLEHKDKDFYPGLIKYMLTGPVIKMSFGGKSAIKNGRKLIAQIRKDYCPGGIKNLVHGSDSVQSAKRELELWFGPLKKHPAMSEKIKKALVKPTVGKDSESYEKTLIVLKPDAIVRGKVGEICSKFTTLGLEIEKLEMALPGRELL